MRSIATTCLHLDRDIATYIGLASTPSAAPRVRQASKVSPLAA